MLLWITLLFSLAFSFFEIGGLKSKRSKKLAIIPLFLLFIIVSFNRMNNDYPYYLIGFQNNGEGFEIGFQYLIKILKSINLEFEAVVFSAGLLLVFTLRKMIKGNNNFNLIILLYSIFPLVYDINQTRNLIMYLIIIITLVCIENRNIILYYIGICLGLSFHRLALIYVPFYYLCTIKRKKYFKILWSSYFLLLIMSPFVIKILLRMFPDKIGIYLDLGKMGLGAVIIYIYVITDVFTVWWVNRKLNKQVTIAEKQKLEILYRFVWYEILILPFITYFMEISRFQRNGLLVKYYYCTLAMKYLNRRDKIITFIILIISAIMPLILMVYTSDTYLFKYLDDNYIFECLKNFF